MKSQFAKLSAVLTVSFCILGCNGSDRAETPSTSSLYVARTEPTGAIPVGNARQTAKTNEQITLVGHIGGSDKPFVDGVAAFTIVDPKVAYCAAAEGCPTPWDYCCQQNAIKESIATIKVVDGNGKLNSSTPREVRSGELIFQ
jgi:hypothetical protein